MSPCGTPRTPQSAPQQKWLSRLLTPDPFLYLCVDLANIHGGAGRVVDGAAPGHPPPIEDRSRALSTDLRVRRQLLQWLAGTTPGQRRSSLFFHRHRYPHHHIHRRHQASPRIYPPLSAATAATLAVPSFADSGGNWSRRDRGLGVEHGPYHVTQPPADRPSRSSLLVLFHRPFCNTRIQARTDERGLGQRITPGRLMHPRDPMSSADSNRFPSPTPVQ